MQQARRERDEAPGRRERLNGPSTRCMSIASPGRFSFRVVKAWLSPRMPTVSVARVRPAVRSSTCAAVHQGRKRG